MQEYYNLGSDKAKAQEALDYINSYMPVLNMVVWVEKLTECADGNYRIERVPQCRLIDAISQGFFTQQQVQYFMSNYVVSIDEYNADWFTTDYIVPNII